MSIRQPNERDLRLALEIVTEGREGRIPRRRNYQAFATEAFLEAAESVRDTAKPWTADRSIQGYGIAEKTVKGKRTEDLALKVYVELVTSNDAGFTHSAGYNGSMRGKPAFSR